MLRWVPDLYDAALCMSRAYYAYSGRIGKGQCVVPKAMPAKMVMPTQLLCRKARKQAVGSRRRAMMNWYPTSVMAVAKLTQ